MFTKAGIERYFTIEKTECLVFIVLGCIGILLACIFFFFIKTGFCKGMAALLFIAGLIQVTAAGNTYSHNDKNRLKNVYAFDMNPSALKDTALPAIGKINRRFVRLQAAELLLMIAGIILFIYYKRNSEQAFRCGVGLALAIEALIMLGADRVAHSNAMTYERGLKEFSSKL